MWTPLAGDPIVSGETESWEMECLGLNCAAAPPHTHTIYGKDASGHLLSQPDSSVWVLTYFTQARQDLAVS